MDIINLTPHKITILDDNNNVIMEIMPTGLARVSTTTETVGDICGIPIVNTTFGEVTGLPEERNEIFYIVSGLVKSALNRQDLLTPSDLVRDQSGAIIGCRKLSK